MPDELFMPPELFDPVDDEEPLEGCESSVCDVPAPERVVVLLDELPMVPMLELLPVEPG